MNDSLEALVQDLPFPVVYFTVQGSVEKKAALIKYTALSWYSATMRKTYIVCAVPPERMQTRDDRRQLIKEIIAYYHTSDVFHLSFVDYFEDGILVDCRSPIPKITNLKNGKN